MSKYDALGTGIPPLTEFHGLFAESDKRNHRGEVMPEQQLAYEKRPDDMPAEIVAAQATAEEAHAALAEAQKSQKAYSLEDTTWEQVSTMTHAVASYGSTLTSESGTDPKKIEIARVQLSDVMGEKFGAYRQRKGEVVDPPTLGIAAIALAKMRESTGDEAEKTLAEATLRSLRQVGDLERIKQEEALGPHTGELAVAAILEYEPAHA
jgi:hypothetical protein